MHELVKFNNQLNNYLNSWGVEPFSILCRNFFNENSLFEPIEDFKFNHPVDVTKTKEGLEIEVAAVGIDKEDIKINIEDGNVLRISYDKKEVEETENEEKKTIHKGISRKSFKYGYQLDSSRYDLNDIKANLEKGLLTIKVKHCEKALPKMVTIN